MAVGVYDDVHLFLSLVLVVADFHLEKHSDRQMEGRRMLALSFERLIDWFGLFCLGERERQMR